MGKFRRFGGYLPETGPSFCFRTITSKYKGIFTKLGMCIDIVESDLSLLLRKLRQCLTQLIARDTSIFSSPDDNFCKYQWIFSKLGIYIDIVEIWFWIAYGQISSIFDRVICPRPDDDGGFIVLRLYSITFQHLYEISSSLDK